MMLLVLKKCSFVEMFVDKSFNLTYKFNNEHHLCNCYNFFCINTLTLFQKKHNTVSSHDENKEYLSLSLSNFFRTIILFLFGS